MDRAYLQALSIVVGAHLRYVTIIVTNARYLDANTQHYAYQQAKIDTMGAFKGNKNSRSDETKPNYEEAVAAELVRPYYLCIGKHSLSILDSNMVGNSKTTGGYLSRVPFRALKCVKRSPSDMDAFSIDIDTALVQTPPKCSLPPTIYMRSGSMENIIQQLQICWKADFMYRTLTVKDLRVETVPTLLDTVSADIGEHLIPSSWTVDAGSSSSRGGFVARAPVPDLKRLETKSYLFFAPKDFTLRGRKHSGHFIRGRDERGDSGETLLVREGPAWSQASLNEGIHFAGTLPPYDNYSPKHVAEHYIRTEIAGNVKKYTYLGRPRSLIKRGNTSGDPASWDAWMIVLRVGSGFGPSGSQRNSKQSSMAQSLDSNGGLNDGKSSRDSEKMSKSHDEFTKGMLENMDIVVIAARRTFIPPSMDLNQDILIVHMGKQNTAGSVSRGVTTSQCILDTLVPKTRDFNYDRIVVQTKADALLLSDEEFSWFAFQHNIRPSKAWDRGRQFCLCILKLLENANVITISSQSEVQRVFDGIAVPRGHEDPFEYASLLEKEANGLPQDSPLHLLESWRRRVWSFFAWCVDGGIISSTLTIEQLVSNHGLLLGQSKAQMKIAQIIDSLLYMHTPGEAFSKSNLLAKVQDDMLMRSFTFNENVMCRLIETGYLKTALNVRGDPSVYPKFLVRLLQRSGRTAATRNSPRLQHCVCKQLYNMSLRVSEQAQRLSSRDFISLTSGDDTSINVVVPLLIRLLQHKDENIHVLCVASLVNYTLNNPVMKNLVMAGKAALTATNFLASPNMDLVKHSCLLLYNCSKTEQYRQTIASYGAINLLIDLIRPCATPPIYHNIQVLTNAVSVLSNLSQDSRLRAKIISALGFEPDHASSPQSPYDRKNNAYKSNYGWMATRSANSTPAVYIVLADLLKPDAPIGSMAYVKSAEQNTSVAIDNDNGGDESGLGTVDSSGAVSMLHFRVIQTLKNLAVRIPSAATSTNEANKRSMRFVLPLIVGFLDAVGDEHVVHIVLELIYVLCFDPILRRDMFNEYNLDLKIRDLFTSEADGLKKILSDLRRLKLQLDNSQ